MLHHMHDHDARDSKTKIEAGVNKVSVMLMAQCPSGKGSLGHDYSFLSGIDTLVPSNKIKVTMSYGIRGCVLSIRYVLSFSIIAKS